MLRLIEIVAIAVLSGIAAAIVTLLFPPTLPHGAIIAVTTQCPKGWEEYRKASGRFLIGLTKDETIEHESGSPTVTLSESNLPRHRHGVYQHAGEHIGRPPGIQKERGAGDQDGITGVNPSGLTSDGGFANAPINIMPPSITVRYCKT
jgi:hypothetical protein